MKKYIYLFCLFALSIGLTVAQAASPTYDDNPPPSYIWGDGGLNPQTSGTPNKTGEERIVDAISGLDINIGDISIDTSNIESYLKYNDGTDDHTQSEITNDIKTEVASISSNIGELIKSGSSSGSSDNFPSLFYTQRHKFVVPNTVTQILPLLPNYSQNSTEKRVFVELRAINPDDEFYIGFDSNTYDTEGRPVIGRILLNMPASQELYIYHINQSDISIQQTEGWK